MSQALRGHHLVLALTNANILKQNSLISDKTFILYLRELNKIMTFEYNYLKTFKYYYLKP